MRDLESENADLKRKQERHEDEMLDLKRKQQAEIDRLKEEITRIKDQYAADLEEERDQYEKVFKIVFTDQHWANFYFTARVSFTAAEMRAL